MKMIAERLRKVEAKHVARRHVPRLTKQERDAVVASMRALPSARETAIAAVEAEPNTMTRERSRAVIEAFWRADT